MKPEPENKLVIDPVCGMFVNPETTTAKAFIEGHDYYFCAEGCRQAFEENPTRYLEAQCARPRGWWGRYVTKLQKATGGKPMKCH